MFLSESEIWEQDASRYATPRAEERNETTAATRERREIRGGGRTTNQAAAPLLCVLRREKECFFHAAVSPRSFTTNTRLACSFTQNLPRFRTWRNKIFAQWKVVFCNFFFYFPLSFSTRRKSFLRFQGWIKTLKRTYTMQEIHVYLRILHTLLIFETFPLIYFNCEVAWYWALILCTYLSLPPRGATNCNFYYTTKLLRSIPPLVMYGFHAHEVSSVCSTRSKVTK